jgi:hypothetical protein
MKRILSLSVALMFLAWNSGGLGELQQVEPKRPDEQKIRFVTLTNGAILQGKVALPLEVELRSFDGIFLTANGGPVSGYSAVICTNSTGRWILDWDTQDYPNGIYDIYLEADSGDSNYYSVTNTITVSNMVSFDPWPTYGSQMWIHARFAVRHADWKVKMFDGEGQYVGYFTGTTTNGFISFIWKFQDIDGKTLTNGPFYSTQVSVSPLDYSKPEVPTNHPNPQLVIGSLPLDDKTPHKLIPPGEERK